MGERLIVVVLGKQGAGKGTQCDLMVERYAIPHVSTGDILRKAVAAGTPLGRTVKAVIDSGALVADDLIMALVAARLVEPDAADGALLDGCTRTIGQATALEEILHPAGVSLALNIDVPTELVTERLSARRVCRNCGTIYRVGDDSADTHVCVKCGGEVVQRDDDRPEAIRQRLAAYDSDTAPLLGFYEERGLLETVDGDQPAAKVAADIDLVISRRGLR
jgi:adenylate kinase